MRAVKRSLSLVDIPKDPFRRHARISPFDATVVHVWEAFMPTRTVETVGQMQQTNRKRIEGEFGWVSIGDTRYSKDVIIHVDGKVTERQTSLSSGYKGDYFHLPLSEKELDFLEAEKPEVVIVGAGHKAMMTLTPRAREILEKYDHVVLSTPRALEHINKEQRRFVAIIHMTC
jgi:hypothetical protein